MENPIKICFSYIRFSSKRQAKGDSEKRQLEIAPRVAQEKGWLLKGELCQQSLGISGYDGSNLDTIRSIIDAAKSGKIPQGSVMIIESLDRLTRLSIDDALPLFSEVLNSGIEIYNDRIGRHMTKADLKNVVSLVITIFELDAGFQYSDKLSYRVKKAWKTKKSRAADGVIATKSIPAWLNADRKTNTFTINENVSTIQRIFASYANGKGIRTIMRELNAEKVAPFGKGNQNKTKSWSNTHIRRLLSFRGVLGEYQPSSLVNHKRVIDGEPIKDYYPQVIEPSLFYRVQQRLSNVKQVVQSGPRANATNLFTGLVKCACCGSSMVIKQGGKRDNYDNTRLVCYNAMRGNGCKYFTIRNKIVERAVLSLLFSVVIPSLANCDTRKDKLNELTGELAENQKQKAKWVKIIDQSETVPEVAAVKLNAYETKEKALTNQIESLSATVNNNPLLEWKPLENKTENRLRVQAVLVDEIESLTIDAASLKATLKLKEVDTFFELSWQAGKGTNKTKENPANTQYYCANFSRYYPYIDEMFVWKSDKNLSLDVLNNFVPDAVQVH